LCGNAVDAGAVVALRCSVDAGADVGVGCGADAASFGANSYSAAFRSTSVSAGDSGTPVVDHAQHHALAAVSAKLVVASAAESVAALRLASAAVAPEAKSLSKAHQSRLPGRLLQHQLSCQQAEDILLLFDMALLMCLLILSHRWHLELLYAQLLKKRKEAPQVAPAAEEAKARTACSASRPRSKPHMY